MSIAVILPWWTVMPAFSYIGAIAVDLLTLMVVFTPFGDPIVRAFK